MRKILVIKHGSLGDIALALSSMEAIRLKYNSSIINLLTEKKHIAFLRKSNLFNYIIEDNRKDFFFKSLITIKKLLVENYDLIIDLQNSQRTTVYNCIFRLLSKALICSSRPFAQLRYKIPIQGQETSITGLSNQLKLLNIDSLNHPSYNWLKFNLEDEIYEPTVLIIPGVSRKNDHKQWPPKRFAEIAKYCESSNYKICVVGTKSDLNSVQPIIQSCKNVINKIDSSPPEVIYSIALKSKLIFSNDTGPGHIASLANKNIIWIVNKNKISKANIQDNHFNHKISSVSVKNITSDEIINYIEKNKLLDSLK